MKFFLMYFFFLVLFHCSKLKGQLFDSFEEISRNKPNIQLLLNQAENLVNENKKTMEPIENKDVSLKNIAFPYKNKDFPLFLATNNMDEDKKTKDLNEIEVDGERYGIEEIKEIIEFNKKLIKLCKIDFSNCFDIKKSILPKKKVLNLLINRKKEGLLEKPLRKDEIDEKIEDDLIDLGLK